MRHYAWLSYVALAFQFWSPSMAWILDADCSPYRENVIAAMDSFYNMANYAIKRANDPDPLHRPGTVLQDLLGAADEQDPAVLPEVLRWLWVALTVADVRNTRSQGLEIHCSDSFLVTIDAATGVYRDPTHDNAQVRAPRASVPLAPGVTNACAGQNEAFTYKYTQQSSVIILCSDLPVGALRTTTIANFENLRQSDIRQTASNPGIDYFWRFLSYKLAHEMMHAADVNQFPAFLPDRVPGGPPVRELYRYQQITGGPVGTAPNPATAPTANNRRHNADSYALLICAWYLPGISWINGLPELVNLPNRPPLTYAQRKFRRARNFKHGIGASAVIDRREPIALNLHGAMLVSY